MTNVSDEANVLVENQQLSVALAQMSEAELKRLLNSIFAVKPAKDSPSGRLQNWDNEGGQLDYAPVYHLLHMVSDGRRYLTCTDIGQARR